MCKGTFVGNRTKLWNLYGVTHEYRHLYFATKAYYMYINDLVPQCTSVALTAASKASNFGLTTFFYPNMIGRKIAEYIYYGHFDYDEWTTNMFNTFTHSLKYAIAVSNGTIAQAQYSTFGHLLKIKQPLHFRNVEGRLPQVSGGRYGNSFVQPPDFSSAMKKQDPQTWQCVIHLTSQSCDFDLTMYIMYDFVRGLDEYNPLDYYHITTYKLKLQRGKVVSIHEPHYYFYRYVFIRPTLAIAESKGNSVCTVKCTIDVLLPFWDFDWENEAKMEPNLPDLGNPAGLALAYILWDFWPRSWVSAESECTDIGGHLPSVTSQEEAEFLDKVAWGKFSPRQLFKNPCRWATGVCAFYIGLNKTAVSTHSLLYFLVHIAIYLI